MQPCWWKRWTSEFNVLLAHLLLTHICPIPVRLTLGSCTVLTISPPFLSPLFALLPNSRCSPPPPGMSSDQLLLVLHPPTALGVLGARECQGLGIKPCP